MTKTKSKAIPKTRTNLRTKDPARKGGVFSFVIHRKFVFIFSQATHRFVLRLDFAEAVC